MLRMMLSLLRIRSEIRLPLRSFREEYQLGEWAFMSPVMMTFGRELMKVNVSVMLTSSVS